MFVVKASWFKIMKMGTSSNHVDHLKVLQTIREVAGKHELHLPRICILRSQSNDKGSLLKLLTGIDFPSEMNFSTSTVIITECRRGNKFYCAIQSANEKTYDECNYDQLADNLLNIHQSLISSSSTKPSDIEIKVKLVKPDLNDFIVIYINDFEGSEDGRQLLKKYMQINDPLLMLVSETEHYNVLSFEKSSQFEPQRDRKMHVYVIRGSHSKKLEFNDMHQKAASSTGNYVLDSTNECGVDELITEFNNLTITTLPDEIPSILSELISINLPYIKKSIEEKIEHAKFELSKVSEGQITGALMVNKCQNILLKKQFYLQTALSTHVLKFQDDIHNCKYRITEEWTFSKFPPNIFVLPFFSGNDSFRECLEEITSWWREILYDYIDGVRKIMMSFPDHLASAFEAIPDILIFSISACWRSFCEESMQCFETKCLTELQKFRQFGTMNQYLPFNAAVDLNISVEFVKEFIDSLTIDDFVFNDKPNFETMSTRLQSMLHPNINSVASKPKFFVENRSKLLENVVSQEEKTFQHHGKMLWSQNTKFCAGFSESKTIPPFGSSQVPPKTPVVMPRRNNIVISNNFNFHSMAVTSQSTLRMNDYKPKNFFSDNAKVISKDLNANSNFGLTSSSTSSPPEKMTFRIPNVKPNQDINKKGFSFKYDKTLSTQNWNFGSVATQPNFLFSSDTKGTAPKIPTQRSLKPQQKSKALIGVKQLPLESTTFVSHMHQPTIKPSIASIKAPPLNQISFGNIDVKGTSVYSSECKYMTIKKFQEKNLSLKKTKQSLTRKLLLLKLSYEEKFPMTSLHEQQQKRLHLAVLANFTIEHKTFTDLILKESISLLNRMRDWLRTTLLTNKEIRAAAEQVNGISEKREVFQDMLTKMKFCLHEISRIM